MNHLLETLGRHSYKIDVFEMEEIPFIAEGTKEANMEQDIQWKYMDYATFARLIYRFPHSLNFHA